MRKLLIWGFAGLVLLVVGGFATLFYTPIPLQFVGSLIESTGAKVEGLDGSIAGGYTLGKLSYSDEYRDFVLENLDFQYSDFWDAIMNGRVVYENIQIGRAELNIKKHKPSVAGAGSKPGAASDPNRDEKAWAKYREKWKRRESALEQFTIKRLSFTQMKLTAPELPFPVELKEFKIDNLDITPEQASVTEMKLVSTFFDFQIKGATYTDAGFSSTQPMKGLLRKPLWKGFKKDVPFVMKASYLNGKGKLDVALMNDQVKIALSPEMTLTLQTQGWSPVEYFEGAPPIQQMNLNVGPIPAMMALSPSVAFTGDFKLADTRFMVVQNLVQTASPPPFLMGRAENGPEIFEAYVAPPMAWFGGQGPAIRLRSNLPLESNDLLAKLYLKKTAAEATPEELTLVSQFSPHYQLAEPIFPLLKLPKGTKVSASLPTAPQTPVPAQPARNPMSVTEQATRAQAAQTNATAAQAKTLSAQPGAPSGVQRAPASTQPSANPTDVSAQAMVNAAARQQQQPAATPEAAAPAVKPKITIFNPKTIPPFRKTPRYPQ